MIKAEILIVDLRFTLEPPPNALPVGMKDGRLPNFSLGAPTWKVNVLAPPTRLLKKRPGCVCSCTSRVWGPASMILENQPQPQRIGKFQRENHTRIFKVGSASARRPAVTHAVAPPGGRVIVYLQEARTNLPPAKMISYLLS